MLLLLNKLKQVCTFHDGCKQGIDQQLIGNRFHVKLRILSPCRTICILHASYATFPPQTGKAADMSELRGGSRGENWGDRSPKTYESNFIHHDFAQFGKQYERYKAILSPIALSQQCCEVDYISLTVVNP